MSSLKPAVTIPNYALNQELGGDARCVLYRGLRIEDQIPVLLKSPRDNSQSAADTELIEREFQTLRELVIEGVPRVYDLVRYEGRCWLALEDRGGVPLATINATNSGDLDFFFKTAIQLSAILSRLHRRGIIHRNVNPRSILVNTATGEVQLTDFGFASGVANESHWQPPNQLLSDSLPYVSPEQTGRMNRAVDYRTDFYSLGVTLYELLTGTTPFRSTDPLEIIHGHIAKNPLAPVEVAPAIPSPVSEIVIKLLSKNAKHRYQSGLGLKEDLEICAARWTAQRRIGSFILGERDVPDHFVISQQLYGRDAEVERLVGAFDRVCEGPVSMMLVSGYAGIGKTSLIQELYKPIVRQRGYFIAGKFDQIARSTPFGALIQAFRGFIHQLLTESEPRLDEWRAKLSAALSSNGGVIAEVIPEIELILGKQAPAPTLGPAEAQNRFRLVFQNFVGAIASKEHPLVIFLDDLQWVDSATLNLFQPLLTSADIRYLFLIGAYRDNEVNASHPLTRALGALEIEGVKLDRLSLRPLELPDLILLIRDSLHCQLPEAEGLARLVSQKTEGNPFFVTQFLKALRQENLIDFDYDKGHWTFQMAAIAGAGITDNVVDLMTRKIQRLSAKAQEALTLGACIGNQFDLSTLALVSQQSHDAAAEDLREALDEGLIVPIADSGLRIPDPSSNLQSATGNPQSFVFLHDRVQQAAYALIPEDAKRRMHLGVGRLLLQSADLEQTDEKLFDVVHHLNFGSNLIGHDSERLALSRLNLAAGRKAKSSTAFEAALHYFEAGIALMNKARWESDYDLAFALNLEAGECQYLCGNFDEAEQRFKALLGRAKTNVDKAMVYRLRMVQYENTSRYADALAIARESLALFGVSFPDSVEEKQSALDNETQSIKSWLGQRSIESLIDLPAMTDPETRMVMNILTDTWSSSYILGDALVARLISATMVRLSLEQGNSEESAYGYVTHAINVGPVLGDYEAAYEFGKLALRVNERFNDSRRRAKINQQFHAHVVFWRRPMHECMPYAQEACRSGLESGDFLYAAYGASTEAWPAIVSTQNLAQFVRHFTPNLALIQRLRIVSFADALKMVMNWARALRGETESPVSLTGDDFDEDAYIETYRDNSFFTLFHAVAKLHLFYNFGEFEKALETARAVRGIAHQLTGMIWTVLFDFWNVLTLAANYSRASDTERKSSLEEMRSAEKSFAALAESCPENFLCHSLLLSAEIERISGDEFLAQGLYDQAVRYSAKTGTLQHQALANELFARFWLGRGMEEIAAVFMAESRSCYLQFGATAKVKQLDSLYQNLFERYARIGATPAESLDVETAIKAAQAIAREINLEKLLGRLMGIAIENAGAERGCLILEHGGQPFVQAEGTKDAVEVRIGGATPLDQATSLSKGIVNYVRRTLESVVLADAHEDDLYAADDYIVRTQPRSILCTPVLKQGRLVGVLYLENNLVIGAFTEGRIKLLQLLSSEAAVSIENARLYESMKQEAIQRRQAEETLRSVVEGTAAVTGGDFFSALVRHLATAIGARYAFVTECTDHTKTRLRTLAFWAGGSLADNIEYDLALTPCEAVIGGQVCHHPCRLQQLFPGDKELVPMEAESFIGLPMCNNSGEILGHLAILDDRPMPDASGALSLLKIFAARASAEFQRLKAEEGLRKALAEVEQLKNRLHAENIYLQEEIQGQHNFGEIVGTSRVLLSLLSELERVAPTDSTVLITGETGTGKELIARAIHDRSKRKNHPLVKVNCGAISAGLVESELFGHVKGAFTGAIDRRTGRFELADGGTLFLDEVSELPLETQVKLLRVLQEGEFEPVGSSRTVRVNVRIIAATNRNLDESAREGRFRSDLFYRLNVFPLHVPPLRERGSDIAQLAMFFLSRFGKKFGKPMDGISQETMDLLIRYPWPGNIRELQNVIERGVVLSQGSVLTLDPRVLQSQATVAPRTAAAEADRSVAPLSPGESSPDSPATLEDIERRHILDVLKQSRWVIEGPNGAALVLNLHPNTLRSRMKKLGIQRPTREVVAAPHEIS
ncbi:MAG TPA: sigma 54-interacting transcriptional regulator [Blastocatellia bacterium]|nr:sigma 54-interacting transcriptional regulator [Blastocatellia bacterium]